MSKIIKVRAIVLRSAEFSNTSLMVTWLTDSDTLITTPAKGALRPKSPHFGQLCVGNCCELLFYGKSETTNDVHMLRETSLLDCRMGFRDNWRAALAADYVCDLTRRVIPVDALSTTDGAIFSLLDFTLANLDRNSPQDHEVISFELCLLKILGYNYPKNSAAHLGDFISERLEVPRTPRVALFSALNAKVPIS